jgi:predicted XRE-type DNA-binding protein
MSKEETFKTGSGDIFKDFGFSDEAAAALTIKASLFRTLQKALKEAPGTQADLAERIGAPQPKISDIMNGKMAGFSVERLANYLLKLDYEICLDAHPAPAGVGGRVIDRSDLLTA